MKPKNIKPNPQSKQIVLIGCPKVVTNAKPLKIKPIQKISIDKSIFLFINLLLKTTYNLFQKPIKIKIFTQSHSYNY